MWYITPLSKPYQLAHSSQSVPDFKMDYLIKVRFEGAGSPGQGSGTEPVLSQELNN